MKKAKTTATTTVSSAPSIRASAEYGRILAKFVEQIQMRPDWSVTLADLDRGVREAMAKNELNRLQRLAKHQSTSKKRILSHKEVRLLLNANRLPVRTKVTPDQGPYEALTSVELGTHRYELVEDGFADHVIEANRCLRNSRSETQTKHRQRNAAARELHRLYLANKLPEGCSVEYESRKRVCIKTPLALFVLHAATEPKRQTHPAAQVLPFPVNTEEVDAAWEMTG